MSDRDILPTLNDVPVRKQGEPSMTRAEILDAAMQIVTQDREAQYGSPENNFGLIGELWATYLRGCGVEINFLESYDVAIMMVLLKVARIATGKEFRSDNRSDNWIDLAGYAACGGELEGKNEWRR